MTTLKSTLMVIGAITVLLWIVGAILLGPCIVAGTCELMFVTEEKQPLK